MARRTKTRLTMAECKWRRIVAEWRDSGLSGPEFCASKGLNVKTMHVWSSKLKKIDRELEKVGEPVPPTFLPVEVVDYADPDELDDDDAELEVIEVHLAGGDVIRVPYDANMQQFSQIVAILRGQWQ